MSPITTVNISVPENVETIYQWRKCLIVFVTSWTAFAACFSSTSLLIAGKEIALDLNTTEEVINASTAGGLLAFGISALVWGPITEIVGRRWTYSTCILMLLGLTIGSAIAQTKTVFITLRVLAGLQGSYFLVSGQAIMAESFTPVERGTASGFFLAGKLLGPPLGPLAAGIFLNYTNWRSILWLHSAMVGVAIIFAVFCVPNRKNEFAIPQSNPTKHNATGRCRLSIFKPMMRLNIFLIHLSCGFLSWALYTVLASPRYVLSTRYNLTSLLSCGLFYIAPTVGLLLGAIFGAWYSNITVQKYIKIRGERIPEDRLNASQLSFFIIVPAAALAFALDVQYNPSVKEAMVIPIVSTFFIGAALMFVLMGLEIYSVEVMPSKQVEIVTVNYLFQYMFAAGACAGVVPMMKTTKVTPTFLIAIALIVLAVFITRVMAKGAPLAPEQSDSKTNTYKQWHFKWPKCERIPSEAVFPIATTVAKSNPSKVNSVHVAEVPEARRKRWNLRWPNVELIPSETIFPIATVGHRRT